MDIAYELNHIMNAKRSGKEKVRLGYSNLLEEILKIMKKNGYIDYKKEDNHLAVEIKILNECKAIKPRFYVKVENFDRYVKRYLPSRDLGIVIISTSKGLMTHQEAVEKGMGGSLIAYCF